MASNKKLAAIFIAIFFIFIALFNFSSASDINQQALINSLWQQILIIKTKILEIQAQLQLLLSNIVVLQKNDQVTSDSFDIELVSASELKIETDGVKTSEDYYKKFIDSTIKIGFSEDDLKKIKKDSDGRVMLLEDLIDSAVSNENLNEFKDSFSAWQNLDESVVAELKKISVAPKMHSSHQWMVSWYQYHSEVAKKFASADLKKDQITALKNQFKKNAEIHNEKFKNSLAEIKDWRNYVLIPTAQAFTCGAFTGPFYHFGGRVTIIEPCDFGLVETITPPCGGLLFFTYPILAANPYLWKKPTPGSVVLGRSTVAPGVCPLGVCPGCVLFPYEAIVLYFGTSLEP